MAGSSASTRGSRPRRCCSGADSSSLRGAARPTLASIVPVALVALCLWRYGPPAEYVMGGKDPGAYVNAGIQIAQRGALATPDPVVASVPKPFRDLFFPSHHQDTYYSVRFMGFFIMDPDRGIVLDQFPHLFPASIAIAYGVNGLTGARYAPMAWTLLAPGRGLSGRRAAVRPGRGRRGLRAPRDQRHRSVVRRATRTRRWWRRRCSSRRCWPGRGRRPTTSRSSARSRRPCSACRCSCAST